MVANSKKLKQVWQVETAELAEQGCLVTVVIYLILIGFTDEVLKARPERIRFDVLSKVFKLTKNIIITKRFINRFSICTEKRNRVSHARIGLIWQARNVFWYILAINHLLLIIDLGVFEGFALSLSSVLDKFTIDDIIILVIALDLVKHFDQMRLRVLRCRIVSVFVVFERWLV